MAKNDNLSLGGGKLYIGRFSDGVAQPLMQFGLTDNITMSTKVSYVEHKNTESREERVDSKSVKDKQISLKFTTSEISPEMLTLALLGDNSVTSQSADSVTDEEHDGVNVAQFVEFSKSRITITEVKVGDDDLVEGTDWVQREDLLEILTDQTGNTLKVSYKWPDVTVNNIEAVKQAQVLARLVFISEPQVGKKFQYDFYKVQLASDGDIELKNTSKYVTIGFNGEVLYTNNEDTPYYNIKAI